jgi:hypothetical protein
MSDQMPEITNENLSKAVAAALSISGNVCVTHQGAMVVAHCFEKVTPELRDEWARAVSVATILAPWINSEGGGDWSMNLFTLNGMWIFPED